MRITIISCLIFLFIACNAKWDKAFLLGNWDSVEWTQLDSGQKINNTLSFEFADDGEYVLDYGTELEKGKYWIAGEYLHTVETGKAEKKVRITQLSKDTMIFEMNRAGYLEEVILVKRN